MKVYEFDLKWGGLKAKAKHSMLLESDEQARRFAAALTKKIKRPKNEPLTITVRTGLRTVAKLRVEGEE